MSPNFRDNSVETHLDILRNDNPEAQALLSVYPDELTENLLKNRDKISKIAKAFGEIVPYSDRNALVMTCNVQDCPYRTICILLKNDLAPEGFPCPVEKKIIIEVESDVIEALNINRSDPVEMELLWDLLDTKILDMRASASLKDGKLTQTVTQQVAKVVQTKYELSPVVEIKLEIKKLKHSIIDSFVATRRAKKKYGMIKDDNNLEKILARAVIAGDIKKDIVDDSTESDT